MKMDQFELSIIMNGTKDYESHTITWEDIDCIHIENQEINEMYKKWRKKWERARKKDCIFLEDFGVAAGQ